MKPVTHHIVRYLSRALHGESLAGPGLPVGDHGGVETLQGVLEKLRARALIQLNKPWHENGGVVWSGRDQEKNTR